MPEDHPLPGNPMPGQLLHPWPEQDGWLAWAFDTGPEKANWLPRVRVRDERTQTI
jgi:hypothetical protein